MRILTVAFFDDNYGDMLIRTCFLQLTKVVLENIGVTDYTMDVMPLKAPDDTQVEEADLILFPGGAMFGVNYLGVAEYIERVLDIADRRGIPVVFSSLGLNHMENGAENDERLHAILSRPCIKAVSVRDSLSIFRRFAGDQRYEIEPVCDPVLWDGAVYAKDTADVIAEKAARSTPIVGLNVVRGGLFKANGIDWTLTKEEEYLYELSKLLEEKGIDYRFFTNGSTWDINTIKHFKDKYRIPAEKLIFSDTSREVVQTEAAFDAVVAIRMHAAIIAYGLGVPAVNYVWNPKIPDLYEKLGYPERAVSPGEWSAQKAAHAVEFMLSQGYQPDPEVLMTLYRFLYKTLNSLLAEGKTGEMYGYEKVRDRLTEMTVPAEEDEIDLRTKLKRGENRYYALFKSDDKKRLELIEQKKAEKKQKKEIDKLKQKLEKESAARKKAEQELDRLNQLLVIRAYRKLKPKKKK